MALKSKLVAAALTALVLAGGLAATTEKAEAKWRPGIGIGVGIGLGLAGAALGSGYYYHHCRWAPVFNRWGDYVGSQRRCAW